MEPTDAQILATALNDPDGRARVAAAEALASRGAPAAVEALDPLARSTFDAIAQRAAVALWVLRPACDPTVRAAIDRALEAYRIVGEAQGTALLRDPALLVAVESTGAPDLRRGIDALAALDPPRRAVATLTELAERLHATELGPAVAWSLFVALERCATELTLADTPLLLPLLERWHRAPDAATLAASTLVRLAETEPAPLLRAALPHLRGGTFRRVPPAFAEARAAIERATAAWKDLPLPALAPTHSDDLPRPSEPSDA